MIYTKTAIASIVLALALSVSFTILVISAVLVPSSDWQSLGLLISVLLFLCGLPITIMALFQKHTRKHLPAIAIFLQLAIAIFAYIALTHRPSVPVTVAGAQIVDYGVYEHPTFRSPQLVQKTDTIIAVLDTRFGFRYKLNGSPAAYQVPVRLVWLRPGTTPATVAEDTIGRSSSGTASPVLGETSATIYRFDHEWELLPGRWVFQVWSDSGLVVEKAFHVILPP